MVDPLASAFENISPSLFQSLVQIITQNGTTSYEFDQLGRVVKITQPAPGSSDSPWIAFTYDLAGRRLTETNRQGHATTYEYLCPCQLRGVIFSKVFQSEFGIPAALVAGLAA